MAETVQSLLVLRDHKVLGEGAQSHSIIGSIVHPEILELVTDAVLVYYLNNDESPFGTWMTFGRLAPRSGSILTTLQWPLSAASDSGILPSASCVSTSISRD